MAAVATTVVSTFDLSRYVIPLRNNSIAAVANMTIKELANGCAKKFRPAFSDMADLKKLLKF